LPDGSTSPAGGWSTALTVEYPRELVGYGKDRPRIAWPDGARLALSLVVNYEEGSERSPLYGDPATEPMTEGFGVPRGHRDLHNESFYDYGTRVAFWRMLALFEAYRVPVTFYACAMALEQNPEAARAITASGHEPCSHGWRWLPSYSLTVEEEREHIRRAVESIRRTTGQRPVGWNTRGPSLHTRQLLVEEGGFLYDSDGYADDLPYFVAVGDRKWLVIPYTFETNDMKLWRPPGTSAPEDFRDYLREAFDCLYEEGATHPQMLSVGLHMRHIGRPGRIGALEEFIRHARSVPGVWFARRVDIARWWLDRYGHLPAMAS
jgi:peptidoglycan/xylan/chitin deacetylase (PgdA/CDA1 family)